MVTIKLKQLLKNIKKKLKFCLRLGEELVENVNRSDVHTHELTLMSTVHTCQECGEEKSLFLSCAECEYRLCICCVKGKITNPEFVPKFKPQIKRGRTQSMMPLPKRVPLTALKNILF